MDRSQRLRVYDILLNALLRLAFAAAPFFQLNLAWYRNSPVHSTKGTLSHINVLWLLVSIRFQVLFHSASAVLFTFPSQYWFTIGHLGVFSLTRWSWQIPTRFHVPRRTQDTTIVLSAFVYRICTFYDWSFNIIRLAFNNLISWSYNPDSKSVWAFPRSLATTKGITIVFFSCRY